MRCSRTREGTDLAQIRWEREIQGDAHSRTWTRRTTGALTLLVVAGLALAACSSSDSVDASALPANHPPTIGVALDAKVHTPADLPTFDDGNGYGSVPATAPYQLGARKVQSVVTAPLAEEFPPDQVVTAAFNSGAGPDDAGFGVICRMKDEQDYYRLGVGNDGYYAIQQVVAGKTTVLTGAGKWVKSDQIRASAGPYNVRAECIGETLTLFESNHLIASVKGAVVRSGRAGVFVETFYKPNATVQVDSLDVRSFRDRSRITTAAALQWEAFVRAQSVSNRCELIDLKRARVPSKTSFVTRCGAVTFLGVDPATQGPATFARMLKRTGASITSVKALPNCRTRTGVRGPLPPPAQPPGSLTTDNRTHVGAVACIDLGDSTAVVWAQDADGVIGVMRIKDTDRAAWKGYGPDWPPFAYVEKPA
jgi:hypothetical protein